MNPRILKKVCKRIVEMNHPIAKNAWVDDCDSIGCIYIGKRLWGDKRVSATSKQLRLHYMAETSINRIHVLGGEVDYWGDPTDPLAVYDVALDHVLWTYGEKNMQPLKDEHGNVIDELEDWPKWKGRITAKDVIEHLKTEIAEQAA